MAKASRKDGFPWIVEGDHEMMIDLSDTNVGKVGRCLAQIACHQAQVNGMTEFTVCEHDVTALVKAPDL